MGQCPCGELFLTRAFRLPGSDMILAVDDYRGCAHCGNPPGYTLHLFSPAEWETWREFGTVSHIPEAMDREDNAGYGWWLPFVGPRELAAGVLADEELREVEPAAYGGLADLLTDHGLPVLRAALRERDRREKTA